MGSEDTKSIPPLIAKHQDLLVCPACRGEFFSVSNEFLCRTQGHEYRCEGGIPLLFEPNGPSFQPDVTNTIRAFYEQNPFPSYDNLDSPESLRQKASRGIFTQMLDEQIPPGTKILEIGCGTGQLSNFLGLSGQRTVFATDISITALKIGQEFKERNQIDSTIFLQMNLFRPTLKENSFDVVICNGVLHHTSDPLLGLKTIVKLAKEGGFVLLGLYNKYSRIPTQLRRSIFRLFGDRFKFIDFRMRDKNLSTTKKRTWFADQYKNPYESSHTVGEVLGWFDQTGLKFINIIPKVSTLDAFSLQEKLFMPHPRGTSFDRGLAQLSWLLGGGREGGFFVMIGRKKA